jgi:hypothetical protein
MYGILEGALETGLWRIYTGTKLETADTGYESLRLLRQCSTRQNVEITCYPVKFDIVVGHFYV